MKIAVSGKGGVGKTTFSALLIRTLNDQGKHVLAIDADPDANLAAAIGIPDADRIVPISEMKELVFERTEARPGSMGGFFKLNPKVDDLPDALSAKLDNIKLMRLGGVQKGGSGCICPESTLLRALITHIVLARDEMVVMDRPVDCGCGTRPSKYGYRRSYSKACFRDRLKKYCPCGQQNSRYKR
jgi:CO dehydrogenase maturation factor